MLEEKYFNMEMPNNMTGGIVDWPSIMVLNEEILRAINIYVENDHYEIA